MRRKLLLFIGFLVCSSFLLTSSAFALSFKVLTYDVGSQPQSVAVGDFNKDGSPDLAVANKSGNTVSILLGVGDGTFLAAVNYSVTTPQAVVVNDFNRDGKPDLAVARGGSNGVSILLGNGNGTFQPAVNYGTATIASSVAVGDFDRDGIPDLALARGSSNGVSILFGNGNGTFEPAVNYNEGTNSSSVAAEDFDGDGILDLAVANKGGNTISILFGKIDGTFEPAVNYSVNSPQSVTASDLNKDGKPDLVSSNSAGSTVSVLLGDVNGTFKQAVNYSAGTNTYSVAVADFDGDGKLDLAVANSGSNTVSILLGRGDGTFDAPEDHIVGDSPLSVSVGDFNGDGKPDIAVANSGSDSVSILLNTTSLNTVPGAPTNVSAKAGNGQATVSFTAPVSNGGSPIISYTVTSHPGELTASGAASPITVLGLTNGTTYTFTVTATNAIGTGPKSAPSNSITWGPVISVSPMALNFGPVRVGSTSGAKTVTIKNTGNDDLIINSISVEGANQSEFTQINSCSTILPQSSCAITITFTPVTPFGKESAVLIISSSYAKKPAVNVQLSGQAAPPKIAVVPGSVNFGSVRVGSVSTPKPVTVKNAGISDLTIDSITISGTNAAEFVQENDCSTIAKGSSCTLNVTFSPASPGKKNAIITVSSNDPKKSSVDVKLLGQGAPPKISLAPQSVNFGSEQVGNISPPKIITVKNTGISDLIINSITISGTNATEFILDSDCSTIEQGGSCVVAVTFSPASTGTKNAIIVFSSNDPKKPTVNVRVSGKGNT